MLHVSMGNKLVHWFMIILKGTLGGCKNTFEWNSKSQFCFKTLT